MGNLNSRGDTVAFFLTGAYSGDNKGDLRVDLSTLTVHP